MLATEMEVLVTKVEKIFGDLKGHGFQFKSPLVKHTDAIGDYIEIEVTCTNTGKTLLITYTPALNLRPESISVFLQNISGDTFSIGDYLSNKKLDPKLRKSICLASHHGSLNERVEMALVASREVIFSYLERVLIGNEWESVPINWGDMK